jgi:F0F1-type ATP synthase membrane subunit a
MKSYIITTVATIVVAAVLLFTLSMRRTNAETIYPGEYQLVIENDSIIISDYGRHVTTIHLDSAGEMSKQLIEDNE